MQYLRRTDALRCKRAAAAMAVDVSAALHMHAWQTPAGSSAAKAQVWCRMCAVEGGRWAGQGRVGDVQTSPGLA